MRTEQFNMFAVHISGAILNKLMVSETLRGQFKVVPSV